MTTVTQVQRVTGACLASPVIIARVACRVTSAGTIPAVCLASMEWLQNPAGTSANALKMK